MLPLNTKAPEFSFPDQNGEVRSLKDFAGHKVVLYFYPKDNTPGCTKQAQGFSALSSQFSDKNTVIIGVSKDSVSSHKKFEEKQNLSIILLSDPELKAIQSYDVWKEKVLYGKKSMGVVRTTYLIDENGMIINAAEKVKAEQNPKDTLSWL